MADRPSIWSTRRGWLFCLNAPTEPGSGSHWGFVENFYSSFGDYSTLKDGMLTMESPVWGKSYPSHMRLQPGDGLIFYHGKKARRGSGSTQANRHIKPYQLSLVARIDAVHQEEATGEVKELTVSYPQDIFESMRRNPLTLDDIRVKDIVTGSGLGRGPVATFYSIDTQHWKDLLTLADEACDGLLSKATSGAGDSYSGGKGDHHFEKYLDQFSASEAEPRQESFEGTRFLRDPKVREAVLRRSGGTCEYCGEKGFVTKVGCIYIETHHIIPLSEGGLDTPGNVIGLCPKHHRESHYGADSKKLRKLMSDTVKNCAYNGYPVE